jgi:Predicted nucleotide-binding protein containing TIR-like domain
MAPKKQKIEAPSSDDADAPAGRKYLSQTDVPSYSLEQAIRVPLAIADNYGKNPTKPLRVAQAMNMTPSSSTFRVLSGSAIAYGLTEGGYNSELISITPLGRRIVAPTREGDDVAAKREASLRPRIVRDFLTRYNESKLPAETIGRNVLEEMGVPPERTASVYELILDSARSVGFLREVKGQLYVDLDAAPAVAVPSGGDDSIIEPAESARDSETGETGPEVTNPAVSTRRTNRVFITHGRNQEIVGQLKDLLMFGGFTPVVAIDKETVSKPVPDKVMDDMRSCDAAVIHVGAELRLMDAEGKEQKMLNQNVLIEIGAAMALYGRNFILLVERGATLPSNLHGLYEVRYDGAKLDYDSTMKLLKAFNDFRST